MNRPVLFSIVSIVAFFGGIAALWDHPHSERDIYFAAFLLGQSLVYFHHILLGGK